MSKPASSLAVVIFAVAVSAWVEAQDRIPVFVKSAADSGGFTDPSKGRQDSVKDLQKKLKDSKVVRPVESEKEAVVVLEVLGRETKREAKVVSRQVVENSFTSSVSQ